jgi:hypothetical protein
VQAWKAQGEERKVWSGRQVEGRESSRDTKKRLWGGLGYIWRGETRRGRATEVSNGYGLARGGGGNIRRGKRSSSDVYVLQSRRRDARKKESSPDGPSRSHMEGS